MAKNGPMILREAREKAGLSREQLAARMECVHHATIKRWEYGESRPDSCDVARIGEIISDDTLWPRWMCAVDDEYAKRHPYMVPAENAVEAVVRLGLEAADVRKMIEPLLSDLMDGKIHDRQFMERFITALEESEAAHRAAREKLQKGC